MPETIELRNRDTGSWINQDDIKEVKRFEEFTTVDWVEDDLNEHHRLAKKQAEKTNLANSIFSRILSTAQNWLVLTSMGVLIGLIAACLNIITEWLANIKTGHCSNHFYLNRAFCCWGQDEEICKDWVSWSSYGFVNYLVFVLISVVFAYTSAVLVKQYAPSAAGSGISEIKVIVSGFSMKGFLGWPTLVIKSICLPLAIASGLSVGKEGPSVHYAVSVGNSIAKLFSKYRRSASKAREFLTATSAAGVAVAFGSPMGGVLFSIEEISSVFQLSTMWRSYFCALVATTVLASINPFRTGQLVMFEVSYDKNWHLFEVPFFLILGVFGGLYGIIVSKFNIRVVAFRKKYLANYAIREVIILTALTALFCYFNEFLRLDMTEGMEILFHECGMNWDHRLCDVNHNKFSLFFSLMFATVVRMLLVIVSYGCKVPAGIFVPSMAAGATFGRAIGIMVQSLQSSHPDWAIFSSCGENTKTCITPGTYAFLGAGATLSGITHLTITVVVIMFELTGALRYVIPTMVVVGITKSINDKWGHGGIADQMIRFNGLPFIDPKEEHTFNVLTSEAMCKTIIPLVNRLSYKELVRTLKDNTFMGFPIIDSLKGKQILGYITRVQLESVIRRVRLDNGEIEGESLCLFTEEDAIAAVSGEIGAVVDFTSAMNPAPITIDVSTPLERTLDIFSRIGPRIILVDDNGEIAGLITRKDILRYEYTHSHAHEEQLNDPELPIYDLDAKIWDGMTTFSGTIKRFLGKLFYKDENRYIELGEMR